METKSNIYTQRAKRLEDEARIDLSDWYRRAMFTGSLPQMSKKRLMPPDVKRVIVHGKAVIVELENGKKGVAHCDRNDTFDPYVGYCIALHKARNERNTKLKKALASCVERAAKKGYKHAILNNREG